MKVLILGDGILGSELYKQTNWDFISRKKNGIDFNKLETFSDYLISYDTIINCIAYTNTYDKSKTLHCETNYKSVIKLSDFCNINNKKLIHISTDYVYSNSIDFASENDLPLISENWYTYYKLLADEYIINTNANYLILRCSFKESPFKFESGWVDLIGNFDYVDVISNIIIKVILKNINGLLNIGTELKTMYELAKKTNDNIKPTLSIKSSPKNITMDLTKLKSILN